jgi:acyl-CoA synthetase (AMP-forming)/AMP-acid ligase II
LLNLADALDSHARTRPDHPAIVEGDATVTHAEFAVRVRRTAAHLATLVPPHAVVGVALKDTAEHLVVLYALARAERVILPMDCRWTDAERARVATHFGAGLVLVEPGTPAVPGIATLALDEAWRRAVAAADPASALPASPGTADLLLSLSSGTTGRPKGPMVKHVHFFRRFLTHWINLGFNNRDRFVMATPLYFGGGRTFAMSMLFTGATVVLRPPPAPIDGLPAAVAAAGATALFLVPTQFRRLLELPENEVAPLRRLRLLLSSGAPLAPEERVAIGDRLCPSFFEYYASTEGGGVSLLTPEDRAAHGESVGRPVFGVEVEIVDEEDRPLERGEVGILRYRGPGVATGYYRDEAASAETFRHGWFYPGDLATLDAQGFVTLKGRRKDMIIRAGINIYPPEVEAMLLAHPDVLDAAVVGRPSREFGEEVTAFVRLRRPVPDSELLAWCAARLAPYKRPREILAVDELPRNSAGKVLKAALASRLAPL